VGCGCDFCCHSFLTLFPRSLVIDRVYRNGSISMDQRIVYNSDYQPTLDYAPWCASLKSGDYEPHEIKTRKMPGVIIPYKMQIYKI
jgi:hypothetical protein